MTRKRNAEEPVSQFNPFLKAEHVRDGDIVTLTGWTHERPASDDGQFGAQIIVEITLDRTGKTYDFSVKKGSPTHRTLFKRMGRNPEKWAGKLTLSTDTGKYGKFIKVDDAASEAPPF